MTATDTTARAQTDSVSFEFDLAHSPQKVWRALTEPALLARWLLPVVDHELTPGAAFKLVRPAMPGWDGVVNCRYLEVDALRKLSFTWVVGDMEIDTVVTFTLTPTAAGTRLTLVQSGFRADQKREFGGSRYGWRTMGGKLVDVLAAIP
jgi:uncharacterized protein YndB with AHSA1/START domain